MYQDTAPFAPDPNAAGMQVPDFPWALLAAVAVLTVAIFAAMAWGGHFATQVAAKAEHLDHSAQQAALEIAYHDEVLTMSALMYAATGDEAWRTRYDVAAPKLDIALANAQALAPAEVTQALKNTTAKANNTLIGLETRAFEMVAKGQRAQAMALLTGPTYDRQKRWYAKGIADFVASLNTHVAAIQEEAGLTLRQLMVAAAAGGLLLLAAWAVLARTLNVWRKRLDEIMTERDVLRIANQMMGG
jgi:hypothetical protein